MARLHVQVDNQLPNEKLLYKYFCFIKITRYYSLWRG